jgi:predicted Zn-dependent peptidase
VEPTERHVPREGAQTHIVFGARTVPHSDPRRYAIVLVDTILGGGMSSRLFQRVREEMGLAYAVYTFQNFHPDTGTHGVYAGTTPESAGRVRDAIRDELARVAEQGLTPEEIEMGKSQLRGQVTLSLESVTSRMYRAAGVALYDEPFRSLDDVLALIDAITPDEVATVCRTFYAPEAQTVVSLGPPA